MDELSNIIAEYGGEAFRRTDLMGQELTVAVPVGCEYCNFTGYRGRPGIHELLECNDRMKNLIKRRPETEAIRSQGLADGMTTLKQDGILKVFQNLTDIHEIRRICIK